jgi:hypothetical protein
MECIFNGESVCIRPMFFNADGTRVVRMAPDPRDFVLLADANLY